jgi:hypothetical protein
MVDGQTITTKGENMKTYTMSGSAGRLLSRYTPSTPIHALPDHEFESGNGDVALLLEQAGHDGSARATIGQCGWWSITLSELIELCEEK